MRTAISRNCSSGVIQKEPEGQLTISGDIFFRVIENAGGLPYQLIFGDKDRKDYFLNLGFGVVEMFGVTLEEFTPEILNRMVVETNPITDRKPSDSLFCRERVLKGDILKNNVEILICTFKSEKKWINNSFVAIADENTGRTVGVAGVFTDITQQRQTEQQLQKALERATESDRLKTAFLNNLPHEIRTPLNAIVGFSTLLNEPGQLSEAKLEFQQIITHSSDHLLEIVDDVVEISKIEAKVIKLIRKEVNINAMLQRLYDRFRPASEEKNLILRYETNMNEKEVTITTDGYKLFQSLNNLLSNAVKFTLEGKIEFGCSVKEGKIEFYVSDTGIGIGEEDKPNIFKPFFQAESSCTKRYDGTGLGLPIAKAYIELLGGEIWFSSKRGVGSVFYFYLPDAREIIERK